MRITDLEKSHDQGLTRASARFIWEDSDRADQKIFFEIPDVHADRFWSNPNSFLLAAIVPAFNNGEKRIQVDGQLCPQLRGGLLTAIVKLKAHYDQKRCDLDTIEATQGLESKPPTVAGRTGSFLSGGIDSLATLRCNRMDFAGSHPGSIRDCVFVHGIESGGTDQRSATKKNFEYANVVMAKLTESVGASFIPVYTNVRQLGDEGLFFTVESHGTAFAAVAHCLSRRVSTMLVGSSVSLFDRGPLASHPLLNVDYASSYGLQMRLDGERLERLEKVRLVSECGIIVQSILSCNNPDPEPDSLNCAACARCLLTMLELLVFDKLKECRTYPVDDIELSMLERIEAAPGPKHDYARSDTSNASIYCLGFNDVYFWRELVDPLRKIGRDDLASVIQSKLRRFDRYSARLLERDWYGRLRRAGRRFRN